MIDGERRHLRRRLDHGIEESCVLSGFRWVGHLDHALAASSVLAVLAVLASDAMNGAA